MISIPFEKVTWKSQRWLTLFGSIFLLQFVLIYFLSARSNNARPSLPRAVSFQISADVMSESKFSELFLQSDPALFALPSRYGFSGPAWLIIPVRNYDDANLSEQKEPSFWLALNPAQLSSHLDQFVRTNVIAPMSLAENSSPKIETRPLPPVNFAKSNSVLRVEGELAARKLLYVDELKSWAANSILSNSVAQIAVNQNGLVVSARLLSKSRWAEADRAALEIAQGMQFAPSKNEMTWGNLIFDWHTVPIAPTNAVLGVKQP